MTKRRDIFAELTEGFDALKSQRESMLFALRDAARQGLIEVTACCTARWILFNKCLEHQALWHTNQLGLGWRQIIYIAYLQDIATMQHKWMQSQLSEPKKSAMTVPS